MPVDRVGARLAARRAYPLAEVVACLARQIADGSTPIVDDMGISPYAIDLQELRRLAALCDARQLPIEAARIRRWLQAEPRGDFRDRSCRVDRESGRRAGDRRRQSEVFG